MDTNSPKRGRKRRGEHQEMKPGLNVKGMCRNPDCSECDKEVVVSCEFTGDKVKFDITKHSPILYCPSCSQHIQQPISFHFEKCQWKYSCTTFSFDKGRENVPDSDGWFVSSDDGAYKSFLQNVQGGKNLLELNIATKPLSNPGTCEDDDVYLMNKKPHGLCLIINNVQFSGDAYRKGAEVDQGRLEATFSSLQYKVIVRNDLTSEQMYRELKVMSERDHKNYDSFVCCLCSHGENGIICGVDDKVIVVNDLVDEIKRCPSLVGKPKMFFIQACRGAEKSDPLSIAQIDSTVPAESDVCIVYATTKGKVAYRNPKEGSYFITKLCEVLMKNSREYFLTNMMTKVTQKVSDMGDVQCCESVSRLRKEVHFFRFITE